MKFFLKYALDIGHWSIGLLDLGLLELSLDIFVLALWDAWTSVLFQRD
jgi:hypothetical protein